MKKLLLGVIFLASMSSFADYDSKIKDEDQRMVDRVELRSELARMHADDTIDCIQSAQEEIDSEIMKAKARHGDNYDAYDEKIYREDLQIIARIKARNCIMLNE